MELSNIIEINNTINGLENKIKENGKEMMNLLYYLAEELKSESKGLIKLKEFNGVQFSLELGKYEIFIFLMDIYAVPSKNMLELENEIITISKIANNLSCQKYYCGCISFYYSEKDFNEQSLIFLSRAFINKDFDIAFQTSGKYISFDTKEVIFTNLKVKLVGIISRLFNGMPHYQDVDTVYQMDKSILEDRKYNFIGFK